jgi:8-amino-7-oxononanoate synthase
MLHEGIAGACTRIGGREYVNFASYNYLGLSGHPEVCRGGETGDRSLRHLRLSEPAGRRRAPVHRELEQAIAAAYGSQSDASPSSAATRPT